MAPIEEYHAWLMRRTVVEQRAVVEQENAVAQALGRIMRLHGWRAVRPLEPGALLVGAADVLDVAGAGDGPVRGTYAAARPVAGAAPGPFGAATKAPRLARMPAGALAAPATRSGDPSIAGAHAADLAFRGASAATGTLNGRGLWTGSEDAGGDHVRSRSSTLTSSDSEGGLQMVIRSTATAERPAP